MASVNPPDVRRAVRDRYGKIATQGGGCGCASGCCGPAAGASEAVGYAREALAEVPEGADLGLGCGNPQAIAGLKPGEVVLDLGSGGGLDCFLAARQVGAAGHVIGVDMTPEMIARARASARGAGAEGTVEFRLGEIEHLPVADGAVDVVLSNCVVNMSPDKAAVFREAFRVLRPGGRLAITDVVETEPMPETLRQLVDGVVGCISGAASVLTIRGLLQASGFEDVRVDVRPESRDVVRRWAPGSGAEEHVASALITARKPAR